MEVKHVFLQKSWVFHHPFRAPQYLIQIQIHTDTTGAGQINQKPPPWLPSWFPPKHSLLRSKYDRHEIPACQSNQFKSYIGFKSVFPKTFGSSSSWIFVAYEFQGTFWCNVHPLLLICQFFCLSNLSTHLSMDWLKEKPGGNMRQP